MPEPSSDNPDGASDEDLLKVVRLLNAEGVRYLVVGGFATILHQVPRFTRDVDILIADDEENFLKVISALSRLADGAAKGLTADDFRTNLLVKVADEVEVDVSRRAWTVTYDEAAPNAREEVIDGIRIPYLGLRDLIRSKQTHRAKDKLDIDMLMEHSLEAREIAEGLRREQRKGCLGWLRVFRP